MTASLPVELNIDRLHDIEVPPTFVVTGSFTVDLENQAEAVHVHLHLDDALSQVARLTTNNHFVKAGATRSVSVDVRPVEEPVMGKLKVATGHGNVIEYVEVTVEPVVEQTEPVKIDESLSRPQQPSAGPSLLARGQEIVEETTMPVVVFAGVAILLALGVGVVADSAVVLLIAGVVVLGVATALMFVLF